MDMHIDLLGHGGEVRRLTTKNPGPESEVIVELLPAGAAIVRSSHGLLGDDPAAGFYDVGGNAAGHTAALGVASIALGGADAPAVVIGAPGQSLWRPTPTGWETIPWAESRWFRRTWPGVSIRDAIRLDGDAAALTEAAEIAAATPCGRLPAEYDTERNGDDHYVTVVLPGGTRVGFPVEWCGFPRIVSHCPP